MNFLKKLLVTGLLAFYAFIPQVPAATSVLPETSDEYFECDPSNESDWGFWKALFEGDSDYVKEIIDAAPKEDVEAILGCALKSGEVQFWMVPYYIVFIMEFVVQLAGLIVILMIMVGAYYYTAGGLTDDKEKGKTIITYAIGGFVLTLSSWILVNILLLALTS